jgi:hypothetical protein
VWNPDPGQSSLSVFLGSHARPINSAKTSSLVWIFRSRQAIRSWSDIPASTQRLAEMLAERWTLEDLEKHNKLVTERRSLKSVIHHGGKYYSRASNGLSGFIAFLHKRFRIRRLD